MAVARASSAGAGPSVFGSFEFERSVQRQVYLDPVKPCRQPAVSGSLNARVLECRRAISSRIMRAILCVFIFIAVLGVGLSRELGKAFTRPSEQGGVAMATA